MEKAFDISLRDSQGTIVAPIAPEKFDLEGYFAYEQGLLEGNKKFTLAKEGLLVYRRFRADGVFYDKSQDYKESLALQLGALQESKKYKADVANFLEPWYGIGYIGASFGGEYQWKKGQAPSMEARFSTCEEVLNAPCKPIAQTQIGKTILETIEYFLDATKGKLPISFCDIQSPLNMLSYLMPINDLFMEMYDEPENLKKVTALTTELLVDFLKVQQNLIGDCLVRPGHGFASSRAFGGAGESDDNSLMISEEDYVEFFKPFDEQIGKEFGGTVYHSCGNWEKKIHMVKDFLHIATADGAFGAQTDPSPCNPATFGEAFAGSGIALNARVVGTPTEAFEVFEKLWRPKQKLIAVTYCETPQQQETLYHMLHNMAEKA